MKTFEANSKQEKWIKTHFDSKSNLMTRLNITRPTVDKLCKDRALFYKYLQPLSEATGQSPAKIIKDVT